MNAIKSVRDMAEIVGRVVELLGGLGLSVKEGWIL